MMRATSMVALYALLALACGSQKSGRIEIELAPPGPGMMGDRMCNAVSVTPPPGSCLEISFCLPAGGDGSAACAPVPVTRDRMFDSAASSIVVPVEEANNLRVAAMVGTPSSAPLRMRAVLYDQSTGRAIAAGARNDLTTQDLVGDAPVRVRLNALDRASCAGPGEGGMLEDRAFHAAVPLPNGDVLILGGVREVSSADAPMGPVGARMQSIAEVYDQGDDRFYRVDFEDMLGFERVLFATSVLGEGPEDTYRIYIAGGFEVVKSQAALLIDPAGTESPYGAPVIPFSMVMPASDVILRYNPESRTLSFQDAPATLSMSGATLTDPTDVSENVRFVLGGVTSAPGGATGSWMFDPRLVLFAPTTGTQTMAVMTMTERYGATLTRIGDSAFIWGGNVGARSDALLATTAGVVVTNGTPAGRLDVTGRAPADPPGGLPYPTAFHTASRIGADTVLLAGGLRTGCGVSAMCTFGRAGITTTLLEGSALEVVRVTSSTVTPVASVPTGPYVSSVLHTATRVADGSVVITGGGTTPSTVRLIPSTQVVRVIEDGGAYCQQPLNSAFMDGLLFPRFGHQATELPNGRLLVTGGFAEVSASPRTFAATNKAEILPLSDATQYPTRVFGAGCTIPGIDAATPFDAGPPRDGGPPVPDGGPPPPMCGAGPMPDGGMVPDGGVIVVADGGLDGA